MRTIAHEAGCSVMTVSLALRNHQRISAATREHVREVATRLGYRPNPMVSALMTHIGSARPVHYQSNLAFLAFRKSWRQHWISGELFSGVRERAEALGFLIDEFWLDSPDSSPDRLEKVLRSRNIQGVVLAPLPESGSLDTLHWNDLSSVAIGNSLVTPRLHRATHHQYHGMELVIETLRRKGYRKIGLALDKSVDAKVDRTWSSCVAGYQLRWPAKEWVPVLLGDLAPKRIHAWVTRHKPDVVVGIDGALDGLQKSGFLIPRDLAFAHLSLPSTPFSKLNLSGLNQNWRLAAAAAVDSVVAQIYRNERGIPAEPKTIMVEGFWVEGISAPER